MKRLLLAVAMLALAASASADYLGDYNEDDTLYFWFSTSGKDGAAISPTVDGTISVYKDANLTQTTAGVTVDDDADSITGAHLVTIVLTDAFYVTGSDYAIVLTGATIDTESVAAVLHHFSIENRYSLSAAAIADIWAAATRTLTALDEDDTTIDLDGTTVGTVTTTTTATTCSTVTNLAANAVGVGDIATGAITASAIATDAITAAKIAANAIGASEIASGAIVNGAELTGVTDDGGAINVTGGAVDSVTTVATTTTNTDMRGTDNAALAADYTSARAGYLDNINNHTPSSGDWYGVAVTHSGTAQAGGSDTITFAAGASSVDGFYYNQRIVLTGGTGAGQRATVITYNGTTKVASVTPAWATQPDATTTYATVD